MINLIKTMKFLIVFFMLVIFSPIQLRAQTYVQTRVGFGTGQYLPLNKNKLDRDEHDFKYGAIADVEVGRKYGTEKFSSIVGIRLQYNLRALKGIYTVNRWEPDPNINVHVIGTFITTGITMKIVNKLSLSVQSNIGGSYVRWYQDGVFKDSFWKFYLPVDTSFEYELKENLNLVFGVSMQVPIYASTTETVFIGLKKIL